MGAVYSSSFLRILTDVTVGLFILLTATGLKAEEVDARFAKVQQRGELRVCIWPEYFAISYLNQKNNELAGIDIDMANAFAKDLGVTTRFVKTHFGRFIDDIEADRCDIGMFGIGRTAKRLERIDFSQSYLASGMYAITTKTHTQISRWDELDRPDQIICVQRGTYMEAEMRKQLKHAQLSVVSKPHEREIEVRSGRADVFITDYPYGKKMLNHYDWAKLIAPLQHKGKKFEYAYAVAKHQPQWLARVDQFVSQAKQDGRLKRFAAKHDLLPIMLK